MFLRDMNGSEACPMLSEPDRLVACLREKCALWHIESNDDFSSCELTRVSHEATNIAFAVR